MLHVDMSVVYGACGSAVREMKNSRYDACIERRMNSLFLTRRPLEGGVIFLNRSLFFMSHQHASVKHVLISHWIKKVSMVS